MQNYCLVIFFVLVITLVNCKLQDLHINVTPIQSRFAGVNDVKVVLSYTNNGDESIGIYKWLVPDEDLTDDMFEVTRNGQSVEYVGPLFKRASPTDEDIVDLEARQSITTVVDLSTVYNMTKTGNYLIQYKMNGAQVVATYNHISRGDLRSLNLDIVLQSSPVMVFAVGRRNLLIEEAKKFNRQSRALMPSFTSCTTAQSNSIRSAISAAESYANSASQYLNSISSTTTRYGTWFGSFSSSNLQTLRGHFSRLQSTVSSKSIAFDCSCPSGKTNTFAYVYASQHYKIYLCNMFWRTSLTGTDSQGGTVIHELSHFTIVAGTTDYAYGQNSAKALASSSPSQALRNADNLQYFAENNPRLN